MQRYRMLVMQAPRWTVSAISELVWTSRVATNERIKKWIKTLKKQIVYQQAFNSLFDTNYSRTYLFEEIDYEKDKNNW